MEKINTKTSYVYYCNLEDYNNSIEFALNSIAKSEKRKVFIYNMKYNAKVAKYEVVLITPDVKKETLYAFEYLFNITQEISLKDVYIDKWEQRRKEEKHKLININLKKSLKEHLTSEIINVEKRFDEVINKNLLLC